VRELGRRFTLRVKHLASGTRVVKSSKRRLVAKVGSTRDYLVDHVKGGVRQDKAVPLRAVRKTERQRVTRRRWPGAMLAKPRHFLVDAGSPRGRHLLTGGLSRHAGRRERLVFRQMGGKVRRRRKLRLMWVIPARQRVRRRFPFARIVERAHRSAYVPALRRRLPEAIETALKRRQERAGAA